MAITAPITVNVHPSPVLPAAPASTPAWLIRLVSLLLLVAGPALDVWNPSGKLNSSAAQAAVVVVFLFVSAIIFTVHVALAAVHEYGWSKSAAGAFLAESGDELTALITEAKPLVDQARPALDAIGPLADLANRVGQLEHTANERVTAPDHAAIEAVVRGVLSSVASSAASQAPAVAPAETPATETPAAPPAGAPIVTALPGSAPA